MWAKRCTCFEKRSKLFLVTKTPRSKLLKADVLHLLEDLPFDKKIQEVNSPTLFIMHLLLKYMLPKAFLVSLVVFTIGPAMIFAVFISAHLRTFVNKFQGLRAKILDNF